MQNFTSSISRLSVVFVMFLASLQVHAGLARIDSGGDQGVNQSPDRSNCSANKSLDTVSINVGFNYSKNPTLDLDQSTIHDRNFFKSMAAGFTPATKIATIGDSFGSSKEQFLSALTKIVGNSKNVNFNYAGHGIQLANGEFGLLLPSAPAEIISQCAKRDSQTERGLTRIDTPAPTSSAQTSPADCKALDKYIVTAQELKGVFGDRKVFGIIDACHAGSFKLGPNSSMLLSSQAKENSHQAAVGEGGAFTQRVQQTLDNTCGSDLDGDNQVSMHELGALLNPNALSGQQVASRGLSRVDSETPAVAADQHPIINNRSWTDCFIPADPTRKKCNKSFHDGEMVETTSPTDAINKENSAQSCSLPSGTHLQVLENKQASEGRIQVELPHQCSFNVGAVPIGTLRNDGSFSAGGAKPTTGSPGFSNSSQ